MGFFRSENSSKGLNVNNARRIKNQGLIVFDVIFFIVCLYVALLVGSTMNAYGDSNFISAAVKTISDVQTHTSYLLYMEFGPYTFTAIMWMFMVFFIVSAMIWFDDIKHRHDLTGKEEGSAKFNDFKGFDKKFSEKDKFKTTFLSKKVALSMDTRKTRRNNNVLIIGGSGAGKTRFFVKPNVLQTNCNMVITDPSGELLESTGTYLKNEGYSVKVFNLVEMFKSNCYNPFHYIRDDQGVIMMINCLIKNTTPPESHSGDPFWEKSETALLQALCFYLKDHRPVEEQNFSTVMELLRWAEVDEKNPDFESKLDRIFLKSKQKNKPLSNARYGGAPVQSSTEDDEEFNEYLAKSHFKAKDGSIQENTAFKSLEELDTQGTDIAVKQYKIFKMGAGKTAKSILISCAVRLTVFNLPQLAQLTNTDDIHLEDLGGTNDEAKKQALFVIIPAADSTFNFLVSMMYSQLFETLYFVAETSPKCRGKRLPMHVKFLLDEFANIGTIPEFTKKLATMRKYEISCSVILQNLAQIKTMYKDDWESIIGNSDSIVFLGGKEQTTVEYISKQLGNQTIIEVSTSGGEGGGKGKSHNRSYSKKQRPLMTPDELGNLDNELCVVQVRGLDPFLDNKYDYLAHPNYEFTSDADPDKYGYVNTLNNMSAQFMDEVETGAMAILDEKAKTVNRIFTLEEMIQANPNWQDYPSIFSDFKTVPAADDALEEIDKAVDAIIQNDPLPTESEDVTTETTESTQEETPTLITFIEEYKTTGKPVSESIAEAMQDSPNANFFDDEEEE